MSSDSNSGWRAGFRTDYQTIFVEEWSPFVGATLLVLVIIGLMLSGLVWGVFGGVKFWGDWFNNLIGLGPLLGVPQQLDGFLMHRSRLCFARAFREPFMTAEGDMTKAVILALAIGMPIAALLFQKKVIDPYVAIPATYWIGSLAGGAIFGIGMVFAGGCASGSLWRMGEGHIKLWVAMFFFSWMGSTASALLRKWGLTSIDETNVESWEMTKVGFQAYLPEMLDGWRWTLLIGGGLLLLWYGLVRYNESTEKFTLL